MDVHREAAECVKPSNEGRVGKISGSVEGGFSQSVLGQWTEKKSTERDSGKPVIVKMLRGVSMDDLMVKLGVH